MCVHTCVCVYIRVYVCTYVCMCAGLIDNISSALPWLSIHAGSYTLRHYPHECEAVARRFGGRVVEAAERGLLSPNGQGPASLLSPARALVSPSRGAGGGALISPVRALGAGLLSPGGGGDGGGGGGRLPPPSPASAMPPPPPPLPPLPVKAPTAMDMYD